MFICRFIGDYCISRLRLPGPRSCPPCILESPPTESHVMVPTIVPDNVDYMAIAMEEKARIRDKMPSAILNVAFGSGSNDDDVQKLPNNAEVGFFVSPAVNKTRS